MTSHTLSELQEASSHLHYDVEMLISSAKVLASRISGRENPIARALRESFLIHLCVVIDFLYPRRPKDLDVLAGDFFDSPEQWDEIRDRYIDENSRKLLIDARDRADKELAHLIRKRGSSRRLKVALDRKKWDFVKVENEIRKAVRVFLENVPKERLGPKWELALEHENVFRNSYPVDR
jgi:hypothetical protein